MNEHKETILRALSCLRSDDLERAKMAFKGMSESQMQEKYGQSGKTRAEILAGYEAHSQKVEAAAAWIKCL